MIAPDLETGIRHLRDMIEGAGRVVPFTGAGPALQSIIGGHTDMAFTGLPSAVSAVTGAAGGGGAAAGVAAGFGPQAATSSVPASAPVKRSGLSEPDPAGNRRDMVRNLPRGSCRCGYQSERALRWPNPREKTWSGRLWPARC